MTLTQLVASVNADDPMWKSIAEGLATVLLGILGFVGQRGVSALDRVTKEMQEWSTMIHSWNNERHIWQIGIESRLHDGEQESIDHHDRLVVVERFVDRRKSPRNGV